MKSSAGTESAGTGTVVRTEQPLVEVAGVEPASSKLSAGLLRAQLAIESQAVKGHRRSMTAPARKGVPSGPRAGPSGKSLKMTPVNRSSDWTGRDVAVRS